MNSVYFSLNPKGYNVTPTPIPPPLDTRKRIPVYKVISEPLSSKLKPDHVQTIPEQEQLDLAEPHTARSLDVNLHKKVKYVFMNSDLLHQQQETTSIYDNESLAPNCRDKDASVQDTSASMIDTLPKANSMQLTSIDFYNATSATSQYKDKSQLILELNKQKTLRENLQKSYQGLLRKISPNSQQFENKQDSSQVVQKIPTSSSRITDRYEEYTIKKLPNSQNRVDTRTEQLSKSCHTHNSKLDQDDAASIEEDVEVDLLDHLHNQRYFRAQLFEQLLLCQDRIESIELRLKKRQQQLQSVLSKIDSLEKQNQNLKHTQKNQSQSAAINNLHSSNRNKEGLLIRQHLHYLFTIIILFLIVVLLTKNKQ